MDEKEFWPSSSRRNRTHLRAVAYRMLGSRREADDAVQEAWLRLSRHGRGRRRQSRRLADHGRGARVPRHAALAQVAPRGADRTARYPEPIAAGTTPSRRRCSPTRSAWRCWWCWRRWRRPSGVAFVLHDMFDLPSTRSRRSSGARRRRRGSSPAARAGACRASPTVRRTADRPPAARSSTRSSPPRAAAISTRCSPCSIPTSCCGPTRPPRGSAASASCAARRPSRAAFLGRAQAAQAALVDGAVGIVVAPRGKLLLVSNVTVANGKITAIEATADPERLAEFELAILGA